MSSVVFCPPLCSVCILLPSRQKVMLMLRCVALRSMCVSIQRFIVGEFGQRDLRSGVPAVGGERPDIQGGD